MNWEAWQSFLQMGGYAFHVWGSYLMVPALVVIELVLLLLRKREIFGHLGWRHDELRRRRYARQGVAGTSGAEPTCH